MKKFMKFFTLVLVVATVAALGAGLAACGGSDQIDAYDYSKEYLEVATNAEFAPYEYKEGEVFKGFDIELIGKIAEKLGFKGVKINDMEFDAVVSYVQANPKTISIAAMTIYPERAGVVNFSKSYLSNSYQCLIVEKTNTLFDACKNADDVLKVIKDNNITVNYATGQTGQYYVEGKFGFKKMNTGSGKKVPMDNAPAVIAGVQNGAVGILDNAVVKEACADGSYKMIDIVLTKENYGIAVNKKNDKLKNDINKAIDELEKDGTIAALCTKYGIEKF